MFYHNYKYKIKCIIREKEMMFWTLVFPIILATLFHMGLANISEAENFSVIDIAVVKDGAYKNKESFLEVIKTVSDDKDEDDLFNIEYTSKEKAKTLLDNNNIEGYIYFDEDIKVVVKESGINQTIIKSFIDEYNQTSSTLENILSKNPQVLSSINFERSNYIENEPISKNELDISTNFFYTLIAMACMYGGFLGGNEITKIQANQSTQGARTSIAPIHKLKLAISSILAAITIQLFDIAVLIAYLSIVLKVSFTNQLGYILLICIVGVITGVTYGALISVIIKKRDELKSAILVSSTMMMSFLAGMMNYKMKYIISEKIPFLSYLNPVNLIADSFYSLYYYDTLDKLFINIFILCSFSIVFSIIIYLVLRRQKHASL